VLRKYALSNTTRSVTTQIVRSAAAPTMIGARGRKSTDRSGPFDDVTRLHQTAQAAMSTTDSTSAIRNTFRVCPLRSVATRTASDGYDSFVRSFLAWAVVNLARFVAVWAAASTVIFFVVDLPDHVGPPDSAGEVLSAPLAVVVVIFLAVFTALVTLLLLSPVVVAFLVVYLTALWWLRRALDGRPLRAAAISLSVLTLLLIRPDGRSTILAAVVVATTYGCIVRLPPRRGRARAVG
jgi:hypothetical protein